MNSRTHIAFAACLLMATRCAAQEIPTTDQPLILDRIIPVPGAEGRFDHVAEDTKTGRAFSSVYGNDSVAVIDVHRSHIIYAIREGLNKPQGVAYLPDLNRIVVTNSGDGSGKEFSGTTCEPVAKIQRFRRPADDVGISVGSHGARLLVRTDAATGSCRSTRPVRSQSRFFQAAKQTGPRSVPLAERTLVQSHQ